LFKINLEVPSSEVFLALRKKAGMGPRSIEGAEKGLGRELFSVLLEHVSTGEIVGMGRIVGDGGTVFHVCDMAVLPEYQRMGGGSLIMAEIMDFIDREAPSDSYVNLMADVDGFYEKWGFERLLRDPEGWHSTSSDLYFM